MGGTWDMAKGRLKQAVGALIGNKRLREQGQVERTLGMTKQAVQKKATSKKQAAQDSIDTVRNSL
jgi:uncharacterized protein YjbJ (UPF0337 family)